MDTELGRQIGSGLSNLAAQLLAHQKSSARDRAAMLDKIDKLDEKFDEKFDALSERVLDVCDRGRAEHGHFDDRLTALETRLAVQEARSEGRRDILRPIGVWAARYWFYILAFGYVAMHDALPAIEQIFAAQLRGSLP